MGEKQEGVKISKMVIQLSDDKISLSLEDAKKLHEALDALFGKKVVEHHYEHDYWYYNPYRWFDKDMVYCDSGALKGTTGVGYYSKTLSNGESANFKAQADTLFCSLKA